MENLFATDCIRTNSGIYMNVFEPSIDMISIEDIGHALSHQCRFGGHLPQFYSVAQHSFICQSMIEPEHKLAALLHDASEAYLLDIPSPIKHRLMDYKEIEDRLMRMIAEKFQFQYPLYKRIKEIDQQVLQIEWDGLMLQNIKPSFVPFSPGEAKKTFLDCFYQLNHLPKFVCKKDG
jgi:hypothetical protein